MGRLTHNVIASKKTLYRYERYKELAQKAKAVCTCTECIQHKQSVQILFEVMMLEQPNISVFG